ncbi:MAG TPA: hypothetical protein VFQ30_05545 [Ktedonobacteraceae bacterium]|nr:hypothetical protein [Ktedonobacteraceae bacterium]
MFALSVLLSDPVLVTINFGSTHWAITWSMIVYLIIAAVIGLIAEFIVGWRLPLGFIGAILAALLGIWLINNVINVVIPGDPVIYGVSLIRSLIGAIIVVALWHLLTFALWRRRRPYYRRARV